jgi:nucleotide-binding universal stress UspA family protein
VYKKVLVPLDGSELAECVLPHVESIAQGCGVQNIVLLSVVEPVHMPRVGEAAILSRKGTRRVDEDIRRINSENRAAAEDYLDGVLTRIKHNGVTVRSEILTGNAAESIAEYAAKNEVDLIMIATHGRSGVSRWAWGSVADRVLRSACVPVLMVRAPGRVVGIR